MPESGEDGTTTATSGRKCSALLAKSGPLGSLVRTLLESPLWSKEGYALTWEAVPLCLERVTIFTSTPCDNPSPSNESAETLNVSDIPSSRCLFRLRLSVPPTEGTGSSYSPMLQTPTVVMTRERPEDMRARAERNGYKNGTKYGSLESQVMYDPKVHGLIPTPMAVDIQHKERVKGLKDAGATMHSRVNGDSRPNGLTDYLDFMGLLPTSYAGMDKGNNKWNENSQGGTGLTAMAANGFLPTPCAHDAKGKTNPGVRKEGSGCIYGETLPDTIGRVCDPNTDGPGFRLSPLFTEEMMGFPLMWTTLPFLSPNGEPNPSKPTETPSSRK